MNKKRIFSFGCSFTKWHWPSWADIVADELKYEYFNLARPGIGNVAILHEMTKADLLYNFTDTDILLVNWSTWDREDRIIEGSWYAHGRVGTTSFYDQKFIKKYSNIENDIVKNATAIINANKLFNIYFQIHMIDYEKMYTGNEAENYKKYEYLFDSLPEKIVFNRWQIPFNGKVTAGTGKLRPDGHPDILYHLSHAQLVLDLSEEIISKYTNMQAGILERIGNTPTGADAVAELIKKYYV